MTTTISNSRIIDDMYDTAQGLRDAGVISKRRMQEYAALRNLDVQEMPPKKIRALREQAKVSQAVFAAVLNISVSTIQKWEIGEKKPSGPSLKLLSLIDRKGLEAVL
jgi:putative transcriptional regulator